MSEYFFAGSCLPAHFLSPRTAATNIALDLIADLDSIQQRNRLLVRERLGAIKKAEALFAAFGPLDDDTANAVFTEMYWTLLDVRSKELGVMIGRRYTGRDGDVVPTPQGTGVYCCSCGNELIARSRSEWTEILRDSRRSSGPRRSCGGCCETARTASRKQWEEDDERRRERLQELRSMPYRFYLKTDEWQTTRRAALRRARYSCQLCKRRNAILDVHHNTYERRGAELSSDLLVMCRECHGEHHGKLPVEPQQ